MARRIAGIIGCPMLEDQLLYGLGIDKDEKNIFVVDNAPSHSLREKMDAKKIKYALVTERDVFDRTVDYRDGFNIVIIMNRLGLHAEPKELMEKVQEQVRRISPLVDAMGLYYGLCGNYGWDMTQWAKDNGLKPTEMFRDATGRVCDDCVGVSVGGGARYLEFEKTYTGMFYVIPAIAHNWQDFLDDGDAEKAVMSLPDEMKDELNIHSKEDYIRWMFRIAGYKNMVKMDNGIADHEQFERDFDALCKEMGLDPIIIGDGWMTLQPAEDLYRRVKENTMGG